MILAVNASCAAGRSSGRFSSSNCFQILRPAATQCPPMTLGLMRQPREIAASLAVLPRVTNDYPFALGESCMILVRSLLFALVSTTLLAQTSAPPAAPKPDWSAQDFAAIKR